MKVTKTMTSFLTYFSFDQDNHFLVIIIGDFKDIFFLILAISILLFFFLAEVIFILFEAWLVLVLALVFGAIRIKSFL